MHICIPLLTTNMLDKSLIFFLILYNMCLCRSPVVLCISVASYLNWAIVQIYVGHVGMLSSCRMLLAYTLYVTVLTPTCPNMVQLYFLLQCENGISS